jgi:tetratricopeptide (TPR) repeat protein
VRPYVDRAQATFTTLVDESNALGALYGFRAVPNLFLIGSDGTVAFRELGTFNVREPGKRALVDHWARTGEIAAAERESADDVGGGRAEANTLFVKGRRLYERGLIDEALAEWRKAVAIDPGNFNIRKQVWAIENPERFYADRVDFDWQQEQMDKGL